MLHSIDSALEVLPTCHNFCSFPIFGANWQYKNFDALFGSEVKTVKLATFGVIQYFWELFFLCKLIVLAER